MNIVQKKLSEIVPYAKNAKKHDKKQIANVAESIKQYGFVQPIVIDRDGVIVIGHCRAMAAKKLGMEEVPCVCVDDLIPEQVNALRLVDNKSNESDWDFDLLKGELPELDLSAFDFDFSFPELDESEIEEMTNEQREQEFRERMERGELSDDDEDYQAFLEKFEAKKTTDDCYTPDNIYDAVRDWVAEKYEIGNAAIVRPFYPGGDYKSEKYPSGCVVIDNPPFPLFQKSASGTQARESTSFFSLQRLHSSELCAVRQTMWRAGAELCMKTARLSIRRLLPTWGAIRLSLPLI